MPGMGVDGRFDGRAGVAVVTAGGLRRLMTRFFSDNGKVAGEQREPGDRSGADAGAMPANSFASRRLVAAGGVLILAYVLLPYGRIASALYVAVTAMAAVTVASAALRRPMFRPRAWLLMAAALVAVTTGHAIWYLLDLRGLDPFPSVADAFYLAAYPLFMGALWILSRAEDSHDGALSDALIVGISAAALAWVGLIAPYLHDPDLSLFQLVVAAAYPVADLMLLPMILRLLFLRRRKLTAHALLLAGMLAYFVADLAYGHGTSVGWYAPGGLTDGWWLLAYTLFAAAAWHPSACERPQPLVVSIRDANRRLFILGLAAVAVPVVILLSGTGDKWVVRVAAVAAILLFLLIMRRLGGLVREIHEQAKALRELAETDPLTGAANRRRLTEWLAQEIAAAERHQRPLCLAFVDIDHFKRFNDLHGHAAGDELLRQLVWNWRQQLPPSNLLARVGGEEFVIVFPGLELAAARERLGSALARIPANQTGSAGLARWQSGESAEELLERADAALYEAKSSGRNRVVGVEAGAGDPSPAEKTKKDMG